MECIQAQAIVSEAIDHSPVDAAVLEAVKEHCRTCPECSAYVRALNDVKRAPLPAPPADLADRIMAAARAEAAADAAPAIPLAAEDGALMAAENVALAAALGGSLEPTSSGPAEEHDALAAVARAADDLPPSPGTQTAPWPTTSPSGRLTVGRGPLDRRRTYAWIGVAAVALIAVSVVGALSVMRLASSGSKATTTATELSAPSFADQQAAKTAAPQAERQRAAGAATPTTTTPSANTAEYVSFGGLVYQRQGPATVTIGQVPIVGSMRLAFSSAQAPSMRSVYANDAATTIYIADDARVLQSFEAVTRTYNGTTYKLRGQDIATFGTWPQLPLGMQIPATPDGSPMFELDSRVASGQAVYHRAGSSAAQGIAIPPNTPAPDRANNNPNWTWWTP